MASGPGSMGFGILEGTAYGKERKKKIKIMKGSDG